MGAFLLIKKPSDMGVDQVERTYSSSLQVFAKKGLSLNKKIVDDNFIFYIYQKNQTQVQNILAFDDAQFIATTGTFIYNRKMGLPALQELYQDFSTKGNFMANVLGQFGLIIYKNKELYICNDYTGLYHIYCNNQKTIISSSFLSVLKSLPQRSLSTQEMYEYVIGGSCFGGKTLIKEIELLDHKGIIQLLPGIKLYPEFPAAPPYVKRFEDVSSIEKTAREVANDMIDYFTVLKANFGDSICSALTGGIHTRLMLGCMKQAGIKPAYVYQFGDPNNKTGRDANAYPIAKSIAEAEGLKLDFLDTTKIIKIAPEKYRDYIERSYYLGDGLAHEVGIFHSSFNPDLRFNRAGKAKLILNGAGGEAFRNYWVLPDHPFTAEAFIKARFDSMDDSVFSNHFDRNNYFSVYRDKMLKSLGANSNLLSRKQVEMVQPDFENRYWTGNNNSINNMLSYYLTPFCDTQITYRACDVPLKFKNWNIWEGYLMRAIDPSLAKFPTAQGVNLMNGKVELGPRLDNMARQHIPIWLKAYLRKHFYNGAGEHLRWSGNNFQLPYNLTWEYLDQIFPNRDLSISEYFKIDIIGNPAVLSRALTADLVINNRL